MLFRLGRRFIYGGIGFFALLGFASVPLGDKTGWGHLQAIAATPAATHAMEEFKGSAGQYQHRLIGWLSSLLQSRMSSDTAASASTAPGPTNASVPQKPKKRTQLGSVPIPTPPLLPK